MTDSDDQPTIPPEDAKDACGVCNGNGGGYIRAGVNDWDYVECEACKGTGDAH